MNDRILITGGSGFIGTNLIEKLLLNKQFKLLSIDISKPKIESHISIWKEVDIRNFVVLKNTFEEFKPNIVIHLAARTDLRGKSIEDYDTNTTGVLNLLQVMSEVKCLQRVIFTSSMYVCNPGYSPQSFEDYHPHTIYGESKVMTEKIIKESNPDNYCWSIIRPTSIWGPWFGEPYADFFHIVMGRKYFHMGTKACKKTYGYIENTVYQIECIINAPSEIINKKVYYLGDWPAYDISEWADEIAEYIGIRIPNVPFALFRVLGLLGDALKIFGIKFPMSSFRLKNMTTDNIQKLDLIQEIASDLPVLRTEGVKRTIDWIISNKH